MSAALSQLVALLRLEPLEPDKFRGVGSIHDGADGTYGGHLIGQATAAALATVPDALNVHSLHAYFVRAGKPGATIDYHVERIRDGRSFCNRRVRAVQSEKTVFELIASCCVLEAGVALDSEPPVDFGSLPPPEALPRYTELMAGLDPLPLPADWALNDHGVDVRVVNAPWTAAGPSAANGIRMWIRADGEAPVDHKLHAAMLAYQSDESLADNLLIPFGTTWCSPGVFCVSLDHALWFHRPVNMNEWHFVEQSVVGGANGRGVGSGRVWSREKQLVASFSQEVLMRFTSS